MHATIIALLNAGLSKDEALDLGQKQISKAMDASDFHQLSIPLQHLVEIQHAYNDAMEDREDQDFSFVEASGYTSDSRSSNNSQPGAGGPDEVSEHRLR